MQNHYAYDAANRLSSVTGWDSNVIAYSYDDANRMTATTLPSGTGIVSSFSYDNADRLTGISHVKDGSTTIASVAYTLDDVGNRTQRVDQQGTHTYAYDDLYRLTSVTYPGPATTSYAFDAFGNRTSMTDASGTTDYTYDDADRPTEVDPPSASAVAYTWDDNGNLTDRGSDEFEWDEADRMVSATVNSTTTTFAYRGDGLRESRTVGMSTTTFTWDVNAGLPVVLYDGSSYLYGSGLEAMEQSADWYYFLADGLGSTMAIVDDAGAVQNSYTYDVYGAPTVTGSLANEFDFAGQQTDGDTGLQYLRARYMDPETGVFFSRDPLAAMPFWLGSHFGYASGNPANVADPTGLCPKHWLLGEVPCWEVVNDPSHLGFEPGPNSWVEQYVFFGVPVDHYRFCTLTDEYGRRCSSGMSGGDLYRQILDVVVAMILSLVPDALGPKPAWGGQERHTFRDAEGHVNPATQEEKQAWIEVFRRVASDPANRNRANDSFGRAWYGKILDDGTQVWVSVDKSTGKVLNGGVNKIPK